MATLVGLSAFTSLTYGIAAAETGINVQGVTIACAPEFKQFLMNKTNDKIGFAVGAMESTITIEGQITLATGIMAAVVSTALVPGNSIDYFGQSAGGCYLDSATVTLNFSDFKSVSAQFTRSAGIA